MLSKSELCMFETDYFIPLLICDHYVELQSINTGHCWLVQKLRHSRGVMLHHKKDLDSPCYHQHRHCCGVRDALDEIKRYDEYMLLL